MRRWRWVILVGLGVMLAAGPRFEADACEGTFFEVVEAMVPFRHCVMYFYDSKSTTKEAMEARLVGETKKWADKVNVVFTAVDVSSERQKYILEHYKVKKAPQTIVISPEDAIITRVPELAGEDRLKKVFISPMKEKIGKELGKHKVVFLTFVNKKTKHAKELKKVVKDSQKLIKEFGWCTAGMIEIDPKDKKEEHLLKNLDISPDLKEATLLVAFGSGWVVNEKLTYQLSEEWKLSPEDLLGVVQVLGGPCSCSMPDMLLGKTLLMVREVKKPEAEKPKGN